MGWDVFLNLSPKGPVAFSCRALVLPFTDQGIQVYRLKRFTSAFGQSVVFRHTWASTVSVSISVSVSVSVAISVKMLNVKA